MTVTSLLPTEDPVRARLLAQRYSERQRLIMLEQRLAGLTGAHHGRAMEAIEASMEHARERLAEINGALGGQAIEVQPAIDADTPRDQWRRKLHQLHLSLGGLPPGCARPAAQLRAAIEHELEQLNGGDR